MSQEDAKKFAKTGILLGSCEGSRETEWLGWKVFANETRLIAAVVDETGYIQCGEEIHPGELSLYCDDPKEALRRLYALIGE